MLIASLTRRRLLFGSWMLWGGGLDFLALQRSTGKSTKWEKGKIIRGGKYLNNYYQAQLSPFIPILSCFLFYYSLLYFFYKSHGYIHNIQPATGTFLQKKKLTPVLYLKPTSHPQSSRSTSQPCFCFFF